MRFIWKGGRVKMGKVYEFLNECEYFFVGTINGDKPEVRPFGAVMEYDHHIYITTAKEKDIYKQINDNGNIQIVALKYGTRNWLRLSGKAIEEESIEMKQRMLDTCPVLNKRYESANDVNFVLLKIIPRKACLYTDEGVCDIE